MTNKSFHNQAKKIFAEALELEKGKRAEYLDEVCENNSALRKEVESLLESFAKSEDFIETPAFKVSKIPSWQKVSEVLGLVLEQPENERLDYLKEICGEDKSLLAEVESLLAFDTSNFQSQSPLLLKNSVKDKTIGNYTLIKEIGHGGMGVVYLASRNDDFRQRVAVKLVKSGLDSKEVIRRFKNERQILASLHHPNIAQLLDGGTTENGTPYFVMEYIEGLPLLQYCDEHQLSTNERLDRFKKICSAVQHAHQNLVIHRDLKPNNIFVTHEGEPKLLDFGIAKFLNPELVGELNQTQTQFRVMTPEYASPEQIKGSHITTASDIYSLGVILYELLTSEKPFNFEGKNLEQIFQTVTQSEPIAPSSVVSRKISANKTNPQSKLRNPQLLKGDLDNIVLMALRKEPARRYKSVEQFAEDIQRHLKGLPVIACPNTFSYRAEKFIKRNLVASIVGALLFLTLIGGIAVSLWFANIASKESVKAQKINAFLRKTFTEAPFEAKGQNLKFAEVLDTASQRAETELADEPEVKLQILATLATTYSRIGSSEKAEVKARAAVELSNQLYGEIHPYTSFAIATRANILLEQGKIDESQQQYEKVVEIEEKLSPKGSQIYGIALGYLAEICVRKGKLPEAIEFQQKALEMNRRFFGEDSIMVAQNFIGLGRVNERLGNLDESEKNFRYSIEINRKLLPNSRTIYAESLLGLGSTLARLGKFDESEKVLLESVGIFKDIMGANSMPVAEFQNYLLVMYYLKGDYQKVESIGTETLKKFIDNGGKDTNGYYATLEYLGIALAKNGKKAEGETMLRESLEKRTKTAIPNDWRIFNTRNLLAVCLTEQSKFEEAEKLLSESKDFFTKTYSEKDYRTLETDKYLNTLNEKRAK